MPLHPDAERLLQSFGAHATAALDSEEAERTYLDALEAARGSGASSVLGGEREAVAHVDDHAIDGPAGQVPLRIYHPAGDELPVIVFFHGGVFILGDLDMHDAVLRRLANAIPATIVSVDYRLAPRDPFPAAVDDAFAALTWASRRPPELGSCSGDLVVMGDSAGGALAAVTAARARDAGGPAVRLQVLVYPMIDPALTGASADEFAEGYLTTKALLALGWKVYLDGRAGEPYSSPAAIEDLAGLPPTVLVTAGFDPLRDEGRDFGDHLRRAGVDVTVLHYGDQIHGFAFMPAVIGPANDALRDLAAVVRSGLQRP